MKYLVKLVLVVLLSSMTTFVLHDYVVEQQSVLSVTKPWVKDRCDIQNITPLEHHIFHIPFLPTRVAVFEVYPNASQKPSSFLRLYSRFIDFSIFNPPKRS